MYTTETDIPPAEVMRCTKEVFYIEKYADTNTLVRIRTWTCRMVSKSSATMVSSPSDNNQRYKYSLLTC